MSNVKMSTNEIFKDKTLGFPVSWSDEQVRAAVKAIREHDSLTARVSELEEALELMIDFAEQQMHPEHNDPSMFDDEDFGNLNHSRKILGKGKS